MRRLARLEADLQAPYIAEHRDELTAIRDASVEALRKVRAYVAEHG